MKKLLLCVFFIAHSFAQNAQELPKIIPPSPNASAFHSYGGHSINDYSGSLNLSIPIYTISQKGISIPISLSYSGGNGIKVNQQASQVGLGWNLNAIGMISRVIKDEADDGGSGYMNLPELLDITVDSNYNYINDNFQVVSRDNYDSEPDKYLINCFGLNFEFYFGKNGEILTIPRNSVKITYNTAFDNSIDSFEVKNESGIKYIFSEKESQKTSNKNSTDNSFVTSSWLVTKIIDLKTLNEITFDYDNFYEYPTMEQTISQYMFGDVHQTMDNQKYWVQKDIRSKKISSINFNKGKIEFNYSKPYERTDVSGEYYVKNMEISSSKGLIKQFVFDYEYFSDRLQLKSFTEKNAKGDTMPSHQFIYDESLNLPERESNGIDHWGFYNGQNKNQSLEPKRFVRYTNVINTPPVETIWGTGNRNAWDDDLRTSNLGALKEISYPTGGKSEFYYESHDCVCEDFPSVEITKNHKWLTLSDVTKKGKVIIINELDHLPFTKFLLTGNDITYNGVSYYPYYKILLGETFIAERNFRLLNNDQKYFTTIDDGTYRFVLNYYDSNMNKLSPREANDHIIIKAGISWVVEDSNINKKIGGFRIGEIKDYDSDDVLISSTRYSYLSDDGNSSGKLLSIPNYVGYAFPYNENATDTGKGITRLLQPFIPIEHHNGSHIVYSKVRKTQKGIGNNGYLDRYYSFADNLDFGGSYMAKMNISNGILIELPAYKNTFPLPPKRNNSHARGLLEKEIYYDNANNKVFKREKFYTKKTNLFGTPDLLSPEASISSTQEDNLKIKGLTFFSYHNNAITPTYYYLSTGYSYLDSSTETYYHNDSIFQTTSYTRDLVHYEIPIKTQVVKSNGELLKKEVKFVFNKSNKTPAEQNLFDKNALYLPLESKSYKGSVLLGSQYTNYKDWGNNIILPDTIQTSKSTNSLEDRIIYHDYDNNGNPTEVSKKDGTHIVYIWGYNQTQPIAKIENATYSEVEKAIESISNTTYNSLSEIQNLSNLDKDIGSETYLRTALNDLRNVSALNNAQVTTFTYDPLIGVTSVTDPRGETIYYSYDNFNRLEFVKDAQGNILSKNEYNYKN